MNPRGVDWRWEMKCVLERGADEEEEEGQGWRGSCWGIELVSMLIALIWRGWWTEDSTSALIQPHFPRSQLLDSQLSPPKNPESHWLKLWGYDAAFPSLLLSVCQFFFFFRDGADLERSDIKDCLILTKQPVPRLFKFSWLERHVPVRGKTVLFAQRLWVSSSCSHYNKKTWKNT